MIQRFGTASFTPAAQQFRGMPSRPAALAAPSTPSAPATPQFGGMGRKILGAVLTLGGGYLAVRHGVDLLNPLHDLAHPFQAGGDVIDATVGGGAAYKGVELLKKEKSQNPKTELPEE